MVPQNGRGEFFQAQHQVSLVTACLQCQAPPMGRLGWARVGSGHFLRDRVSLSFRKKTQPAMGLRFAAREASKNAATRVYYMFLLCPLHFATRENAALILFGAHSRFAACVFRFAFSKWWCFDFACAVCALLRVNALKTQPCICLCCAGCVSVFCKSRQPTARCLRFAFCFALQRLGVCLRAGAPHGVSPLECLLGFPCTNSRPAGLVRY